MAFDVKTRPIAWIRGLDVYNRYDRRWKEKKSMQIGDGINYKS